MTDLETRLRTLRVDVDEGAPPAELRRRATARARRRKRQMVAMSAVVVVVVIVAAGAAVRFTRPEPGRVTTGPGPSPEPPRTSPNRVIGDVDGVHVEVSPRTDLLDGDLVDVRIDGIENLGSAVILQCAGDATEADAVDACDRTGAVQQPDADVTASLNPAAAEQQTVSVARTIHISRGPRPYDCATEEAGCVLAVAPLELPVRAVTVPLTFRDVPQQAPTAELAPDTGLQGGDEVTLMAEGLRPNGTFRLQICEATPSGNCDEQTASTATTDADGMLNATVTAHAAIYGPPGRTDCTTMQCAVVLRLDVGERLVEVPFSFADNVTAPVPALELQPPGPYTDGQEVTVHGTGFPPGADLTDDLGLCPADKDPAVEERCSYSVTTQILVGADGTFTTTVQLHTTPRLAGSCVTGPGCVFGWVITNGPFGASVALEFESSSQPG